MRLPQFLRSYLLRRAGWRRKGLSAWAKVIQQDYIGMESVLKIIGATNSKQWLGHAPGDLLITGAEWRWGVVEYTIQLDEPFIRCSHLIPSLRFRRKDGDQFIMGVFRGGVDFNEVLP